MAERAAELFGRLESEGEAYLEELIATRKSEEFFLDFKRSENGGATPHLADKDRRNLAHRLSGFGNSEGGVVVWGIQCTNASDGDVARAKQPIVNARRFASLIENAVSGCTVPAVPGCRSVAMARADGSGFVATYVPRSPHSPH